MMFNLLKVLMNLKTCLSGIEFACVEARLCNLGDKINISLEQLLQTELCT